MHHHLPSPPSEDSVKLSGAKRNSSSKSTKPSHRISKRASTCSTTHSHLHSPISPTSSHSAHSTADGRHKRVWKACERCRMKKTKCDGEFPCKRCKDDGLVCTAGTRKKTEFKQLPRGYAEVLENTQFALIATVHKLYWMVRNGEQWDLGEPDLNDRGQPVIHNIAQKLGCIRPNSDIDLPVHSVFPEDEKGLADLASQLEAQQQIEKAAAGANAEHDARTDRASSSDLDHSDLELDPPALGEEVDRHTFGDYRKVAFGSSNQQAVSPQSLICDSFDAFSAPSSKSIPDMTSPVTNTIPPTIPMAAHWSRQESMGAFNTPSFFPSSGAFDNMDLLSQGLLENNFGDIKPHVLDCPNPEVMLGMGDPMMYSGPYPGSGYENMI